MGGRHAGPGCGFGGSLLSLGQGDQPLFEVLETVVDRIEYIAIRLFDSPQPADCFAHGSLCILGCGVGKLTIKFH
jgi:hypothetical protein